MTHDNATDNIIISDENKRWRDCDSDPGFHPMLLVSAYLSLERWNPRIVDKQVSCGALCL